MARKYLTKYSEHLQARETDETKRRAMYKRHANGCTMKAEAEIPKRYPRLRKYYRVEAGGRIRPVNVCWMRVLRYLIDKKERIDFEMQVTWIKEERLLHKKRVFLNLTNDLQWGDLQPYRLAKYDWIG